MCKVSQYLVFEFLCVAIPLRSSVVTPRLRRPLIFSTDSSDIFVCCYSVSWLIFDKRTVIFRKDFFIGINMLKRCQFNRILKHGFYRFILCLIVFSHSEETPTVLFCSSVCIVCMPCLWVDTSSPVLVEDLRMPFFFFFTWFPCGMKDCP